MFEVNEDVGSSWISLESKIGVGGLSIILMFSIFSFSFSAFGFSVLSLKVFYKITNNTHKQIEDFNQIQ